MKYNFNYTYRFYENNIPYAFDYVHLTLAELDELYNDCLDLIEENVTKAELIQKWGQEEVDEALEALNGLFEQGLFYTNIEQKYNFDKVKEKGLISLPPVHQCNLQCPYCFAQQGKVYKGDERKFTYDMVDKALRFVYYDYMPQCKKYRIDFVSGGEPLLNFDVIKYVKQVGDQLYKETNKPLELWLATNGTLLTDEVVEYLDKNNINIGISLDGDEAQHDLLRKDMSGNGTYHKIVNNIKRIQESKVYSRHTKDIWGLVVITSKTRSLVDILVHHHTLGFKNVQMKIVRLDKSSEYAINETCVEKIKEMYTELFDFFTEELKKKRITYLKMILNDNDFAGKIVRRLLLRYVVESRCQAGKNKVSIAANGDIYPCDSFVGMEKYRMGNIFESGIQSEFASITTEKREACSKCWAKYICGGDCYHNSCLVNGSIYEPDAIICEIEKHVIRKALVYIDQLSNKEPSQYEYLIELLSKREKMLL